MEKKQHPKWYALSVYARQEKAAYTELRGLGIESFLPTASVRRLWSDRVKQIQQALFPGYLFVLVDLNLETRIKIIRLRQVIDFVGKYKSITQNSEMMIGYIPNSQIETLKLFISSQRALEPTLKLVAGTEVKVMSGPLKGATGIVEKESSGKRRIVVQVPLLGRGVRTELNVDDVLSYEELHMPVAI